MPSRRAMLMSSIPLALAMAGCAARGGVTPGSVIADASAIVDGLNGALAQVMAASPSLIPSAVAVQVSMALASARGLLAQITGATSAASGASVLAQVESDVNTALGFLAPLVPPPYNAAVIAAAVLLPIIEAFVAQYITPPPVPAAVRKLSRSGMSEEEARAVLREAAARQL